jgi:hypothetical protein
MVWLKHRQCLLVLDSFRACSSSASLLNPVLIFEANVNALQIQQLKECLLIDGPFLVYKNCGMKDQLCNFERLCAFGMVMITYFDRCLGRACDNGS